MAIMAPALLSLQEVKFLAATATTMACLLFAHQSHSFSFSPPSRKSHRVVAIASPSFCRINHNPCVGNGCGSSLETKVTAFHGTSLSAINFGVDQAIVPLQDVLSSMFSDGLVPLSQAAGINALLFALLSSKLTGMLTPQGFAHSFALGSLLWHTLGWKGWSVCVVYLFLGQIVTKIRFKEKEEAGISEKRGGRRGPENVWGSALTGLICAACSVQGDSFLGIQRNMFILAFVASLATKLADTFASEIGKAYGKTTFLITTLEKVPPGTEGAISTEGTAAAVVGGFLLSAYAYFLGMISLQGVLVATVAAFLATNAESLIGATMQEKKGFAWMTNEVVNFINTLIGAILSLAGGSLFLS